MDLISLIKEEVVQKISAIIPRCKILHQYSNTADTHFFQVVGPSIFDDPSIMALVDDIYVHIESQYPFANIAIVDSTSLTDFKHSETLYSGTSSETRLVTSQNILSEIPSNLHFGNSFWGISSPIFRYNEAIKPIKPIITSSFFSCPSIISKTLFNGFENVNTNFNSILDIYSCQISNDLWEKAFYGFNDELENSLDFEYTNEELLKAA
ncbi:MAG: hypothetical protein IPL92_13650 [Saprospiraceae bacterium]|nr:hypothetical protein [Candidatus Opimibacter iunctus]